MEKLHRNILWHIKFKFNEMCNLQAYYKEYLHDIDNGVENEIGSQLIWYNVDVTIGKKLPCHMSWLL